MANVKCKCCSEFLLKSDAHILIEKTPKGNEKKIFLHNECIDDYTELMEYKQNEITLFNNIYEYIKELLGYSSQQILPSSMITRLQDMRNGTIMQKGVGRVIKSKDGYPYEVIYDTLLSNADSIRWAMTNKTFSKEINKLNYLMAIVDSHINDTYIRFKSKEDFNNVKQRDNMIEEEKELNHTTTHTYDTKINKSAGISKFLDDDEF